MIPFLSSTFLSYIKHFPFSVYQNTSWYSGEWYQLGSGFLVGFGCCFFFCRGNSFFCQPAIIKLCKLMCLSSYSAIIFMSLIILSFQLRLFFKPMPTPEVRSTGPAPVHYFFLPETSYLLFSTHNCNIFNLIPKLWLPKLWFTLTNSSRI